jgi:hypothetical protein
MCFGFVHPLQSVFEEEIADGKPHVLNVFGMMTAEYSIVFRGLKPPQPTSL